MSFIRPPDGLVYDYEKSGQASVSIGDSMTEGDLYECEIPDPEPEDPDHTLIIQCPQGLAGSSSFGIDLADIDFDPTADFYAVAVRVHGPRLAPGHADCRDPFIPGATPCVGVDEAHYAGSVSGGTYANNAGVTISAGYEAEPDEAGFALTNWPNPISFTEAAYLINPSPTWPVPDGEGNEYGNVLFELAQLPVSISTSIDHYSEDLAIHGFFAVRVDAFVFGEPEETARVMCLVGHA